MSFGLTQCAPSHRNRDPTTPQKTCTYYTTIRGHVGSILHSNELLREAPVKPLAATTRSQLLWDAHMVITTSTIVRGCSPADEHPTWGKTPRHCSNVVYLCIAFFTLHPCDYKRGRRVTIIGADQLVIHTLTTHVCPHATRTTCTRDLGSVSLS
jgi:hypothetical protein